MPEMIPFCVALIVLCLLLLLIQKISEKILKEGIRITLRNQFNFILRQIIFIFKRIFIGKMKEIQGKVFAMRIKQKFIPVDGEPDILLTEHILVFKDKDNNFGKIPMDDKKFKAVRAIKANGQDMIIHFNSHFLFGNRLIKLMVKPSFSDKFIEFKF